MLHLFSMNDDQSAQALTPEEIAAQAEAADKLGETLISLQALIERHSARLEELQNEMRELGEQQRNLVENDTQLSELSEAAEEVNNKVKARQTALKQSPEMVQLTLKRKELKEEVVEMQQTISNHLVRYYQMTGSQVIETSDGQEREFAISARLKGRARKSD